MTDREKIKAVVDLLTKELVDKGLIVEAGWTSYRMLAVSKDAGKNQLIESRLAFFAGAQHLWGSIMTMLDPDAEPTDNDMRRMSQIQSELDLFVEELKQGKMQ